MKDENQHNEIVKQADKLRLTGDYEKSIALLEPLVAQHAFLAPAKLSLGRAYFESGKIEKAAYVLEEYVEFVPEHLLANKILAKIYLHQKKIDQAQAKVDVVLQGMPEDTVALKLKDELLAGSHLEQDDTVKTTMPVLTPTMAELYYHQGHIKEARKIYEQLLVHDPQNKTLQEKLRQIDDSFLETATIETEGAIGDALPIEPSAKVTVEAEVKGSTTGSKQDKLRVLLARVQERS